MSTQHEAAPAGARRWRPAVWACCLLPAVAVFVASALHHPHIIQSGELDSYVVAAEALREGRVVFDGFHPLGYPLVVAAVSFVTPSVWTAGKLVSAAAFCVLLLAVHRLLRRHLPPLPACLGVAAIGAGPTLWLEGMLVATDMFGAALVLSAYAVALAPGGRRRDAVLAGVLVGLAVGARLNLALHALVLAAVVVVRQRSLPALVAVAAGGLLGFAPHAIVCLAAGFDPMGAVSWKNTPLKYEFDYDMLALKQLSDDELRALVAERWPSWIAVGLGDFGRWLVRGLPRLLLAPGPLAALVGPAVLATLGVAAAALLRRRPRDGAFLLTGAALHALATALTFYCFSRIMLPAVVLLLVVAFAGLGALLRRHGPALATAAALAVLAAHVAAWGPSWREFRARHVDAEIAAARAIVAEHGELVQIAATYPYLGREVRCAGTSVIFGFGQRTDVTVEDVRTRLEQLHARRPVVWFVFGRASNPALCAMARVMPLPAGWSRSRVTEDVVVLHRESADVPRLELEPARWTSGELRLRVELPDLGGRRPTWVGVELRPAGEPPLRLQLAPRGAVFELVLPYGRLGRGEIEVLPVLLCDDGGVTLGPSQRLRVE